MSRLFVLASLTLLVSCKQQKEHTLVGNWKPVGITIKGGMESAPSRYFDLTNEDSLRKTVVESMIQSMQEDSIPVIDTAELKNTVNSTIHSIKGAFLQLKTDSSFLLMSNGFILPNTIPGWHLDDSLAGKWSKGDSTLNLHIKFGDQDITYPFHVMKQEKDQLILEDLTTPGSWITYRKITNY